MRQLRIAVLFHRSAASATLSYQLGWPEALAQSPRFVCRGFNLADRGLADIAGLMREIYLERPDAVVLLHSVFSNQNFLRRGLFWAVAVCPVPKVYFIGNEYKLMPEKISFCRHLSLSLLISQSNDPEVLDLYGKTLGCKVGSIPNTGFNPAIFSPVTPLAERPIDVGYRSYPAPWYLGNREKEDIAETFLENAERLGLHTDISLSAADRFEPSGYAAFLNRCRGQIGTESGGDFFELTDTTRYRVGAFQKAHPNATWPEIKARFFDAYEGRKVPMRIVSGRQVEAAACKTVQILFRGRYNEYFQPDEHYIPLEKDFSNLDETMEKLRDDAYCTELTESAYELVMGELTYQHLTDQLADLLMDVV
ncbi:hypothetical protein KL86APRO_12675 [uncultured Alphaproteobacteria bacterium]|uniref:Glycosyltransferase family 1 protein n=1 Tax=uncultured Alphaproteobacteria bacterium TaxID=91750 RepID=A0A212KDR9_9PROT|nr:hypothetical protein KL86APRO_12675 [uncultured Alphaproteobacteria bacterium]